MLALDLSHAEMIGAISIGNSTTLTIARVGGSTGNQTFVASTNTSVTLTKASVADSFGFELDSEVNGDCAVHMVRYIVPGGIADGELQIGDEVIAINGEDAHHKSHDEMLEDMTGFTTLLSLMLQRDSMMTSRPPAAGAERLHFKLKRAHPAESLGFALCTMPDGSNRVGVVAPGGLACSAGIVLGDNIISVNNSSFPGLHAEAASGALAGAGCVIKIAVDRHENGPAMIPRAHHRPESAIHAFHSGEEKIVTLKIERHAHSEFIGFNVETNDELLVHDVGVVAFGSAAARGGFVEQDRIHAVNGIIADGMTHTQLVDLLRSSLAEDITVGRIPFTGLVRDERLTYLTVELDRETIDQRIGMTIASESGVHEVEEIFEDMVAAHSGIAIGDRITSIDGWSVAGLEHDDVTDMLVGKFAIRMSVVRPALRDLSHGHVVRIVRQPGAGLGLVFSSEVHGNGAKQQIVHTVEGVLPGSSAEEAGLQVWDHLVSLNGIGLGGSPHDSVLDALRVCDVVTFNIERPTDAHELPTMEVLEIVATRDTPDTPFGVHISTRENGGVRSGDTTVQQIEHGSILDLAGVKKNDQLITVNGQHVFDLQHREVEQLIGDSLTVTLSINRAGKKSHETHYENLHIMIVNRPGEQLGFVFESLHHNGATVVELVREGSHAEAAGLLEGDEIHQINTHVITDELSHHMLVSMLTETRAPGQPLVLGVRRPMDHVTVTDIDLVIKRSQPGKPMGFTITSDEYDNATSHYFEHVSPGSDAEKAGGLPGDEIQVIDGVPVTTVSHDKVLSMLSQDEHHLHVRRHVHGDAPGVTLHSVVLERAQPGQPLGLQFETVNPGLPRYKNWVSGVTPGGLAEQAGLQENDVLLSVNGNALSADEGDSSHNPLHSVVLAWLSVDRPIALTFERASHMHWHHKGEIGHKFTAAIQRDSTGVPMGITIAALDSGDTAVSSVEPGSVGENCGLQEGDEVIKINGKATSECTHAEVLNMMRAEANFTMECMRFNDGPSRVASWIEPEADHIDVLTFTLTRLNDQCSFGFALGQDHSEDSDDHPHVVEIVKADKPAGGKLALGDELSKVNGLSVAGLTHEEVVGKLKEAGVTTIELEVKRHKNSAFMKVHEYRHLTVTRGSKDESFGFSLACYQDEAGTAVYQSHRIDVIAAGGLADGILALGDEVVEINGTVVQQLEHDDVIARIKSALTLNIAVQRKKEELVQEVVMVRGNSTVPWGVSFETAEDEDASPIGHYVKVVKAASIGDEAGLYADAEVLTVNGKAVKDLDHSSFIDLFKFVKKVSLEVVAEAHQAFEHETVDVVVEKSAGESFGFVLYESDGMHFVEAVVALSPAANKLHEFDEIKSINGTAIQGKSHEDVVALLQTSNTAALVVHRHPLDPSHGVNKTLTDETEGQVRKDLEMARSRLEMQRALELAMADFTKDVPAPPASPAKAAPSAAAPLTESSRAEMQDSLEGAIAEYGERGAAAAGAAAVVAPPPPPSPPPAAEGEADEALPEAPTSPNPHMSQQPAGVEAEAAVHVTPTQSGSALKAKIAARRAAAGATTEAPEKSSTPLKERIAARQAAAAKTVDASGGAEGATLSPVGRVEPVDPNRKAQADEAFMSTFGAKLSAEEYDTAI